MVRSDKVCQDFRERVTQCDTHFHCKCGKFFHRQLENDLNSSEFPRPTPCATFGHWNRGHSCKRLYAYTVIYYVYIYILKKNNWYQLGIVKNHAVSVLLSSGPCPENPEGQLFDALGKVDGNSGPARGLDSQPVWAHKQHPPCFGPTQIWKKRSELSWNIWFCWICHTHWAVSELH